MTRSLGVLAMVRRTHEERVLSALRERGAMTRAELVDLTGMSRATISEIAAELIRRGSVTLTPDAEQPHRGRGRPVQRLTLAPRSGQVIGVDLGKRRAYVVIVNAAHEVLVSDATPYPARTSWPRRVAAAAELIERHRAEQDLRLDALQVIGVGLAGPVPTSPSGGTDGDHLRSERMSMVRTEFERRFGVQVLLDNNARLAALAEAVWGRASDLADILYLRLSEGIGGGLVLGGRLYRGGGGVAGEMGHIKIEEDSDRRCSCGEYGCIEAYASVPALIAECAAVLPAPVRFDDIVAAARAGQPDILDIVGRAGTRIGRVLATVCNTVNPSCIIVAGEVAELGQPLLAPARVALRQGALGLARRGLQIRTGDLRDEAGALGAVAAVFHESPLLAGYPRLNGTDTPRLRMRTHPPDRYHIGCSTPGP